MWDLTLAKLVRVYVKMQSVRGTPVCRHTTTVDAVLARRQRNALVHWRLH